MGTTNLRRALGAGLFASVILVSSLFSGLLLSAQPVSAELVSESSTYWGLATTGSSRTVDSWNALGWSIEQVGNTIYVGGKFLDVTNGSKTERQPHLAAFDADTGAFQSWFRPEVGSPVLALQASPDGGLFVGGEIDTWGGQTIGALQKIDPQTGEPWPGWSTRLYGGTSAVFDLHLGDDGWLYAVGDFTTASRAGSPQSAKGMVRINPQTGVIDTGWKPTFTGGAPRGVTTSEVNDLIYVTGRFISVNNTTNTGGFVGLNTSGQVVIDRTPVPFSGCSSVTSTYCVTMYDAEATPQGNLFVGGVEHSLYVLDEQQNLSLRMQHYSGCDPSRNAVCRPSNWYGGEFQELEQVGDRVYAVCHCWYDYYSDSVPIRHTKPTGTHSTVNTVSALDAATGERIMSFSPALTGDAGGWAIHGNATDGCLWVAGGITTSGSDDARRSARDLVRLCDEAGPGPGGESTAPAPEYCTVSVSGDTVSVSWPSQEGAVGAIVERQLEGQGQWYWRGRVDFPQQEFSEATRPGGLTTYQVRFKYLANQVSPPTPCAPSVDLRGGDLGPPTSCQVEVDGSRVTVSLQAGQAASSHVMYRSVNGGSTFWRGRIDLPTTTFSDSLYSGSTFAYFVRALDDHGNRTDLVPCGDPVQVASVEPPASCSTTVSGDTATISWPARDDASGYVIYRTVDDGNASWRGRVAEGTTTFTDSVRADATYVYSVASRKSTGRPTEAVECSPPVVRPPETIEAVASCTVTEVDGRARVEWSTVENATDYLVYRSADGGNRFWRGRVSAPTATFDDSLRSGPTFTYYVAARGADATAEATTCGPTIQA